MAKSEQVIDQSSNLADSSQVTGPDSLTHPVFLLPVSLYIYPQLSVTLSFPCSLLLSGIQRRTKLKASRLWLGMKMKRKIKLGDLLGVSGVLDVVEHSWTEENRKNSTLAEKTWVFQYGNHQVNITQAQPRRRCWRR
ncbi:hypothetical protein I7I51_03958 [Histoplasma capsulatum]|uniref:Uncharacterized protein n=3 Tax=Histoplasma TaxID=5036 RepID=A0A8A1M738_AJECA|nr:hypothetical protein I7I51_03958 [Histoplasma capsulatum]